jgi:hypothetical protein
MPNPRRDVIALVYAARSEITAAGNLIVSTQPGRIFLELSGNHSGPGISRLTLLTFFFSCPLDKEFFEFFLRVNAFVNQQGIHRIDCRPETFIPRGVLNGFIERHNPSWSWQVEIET